MPNTRAKTQIQNISPASKLYDITYRHGVGTPAHWQTNLQWMQLRAYIDALTK